MAQAIDRFRKPPLVKNDNSRERIAPSIAFFIASVAKSFGKSLKRSQRMLTHVRRLCLRESQ